MTSRVQIPTFAQVRGLSLVELMVSMALGVLLSSAMVSAYLNSKLNHFQDEQQARMQENGRYALRLLSRELGMAGFFGASLSIRDATAMAVNNDCALQPWALNGEEPLAMVNDFSPKGVPVTTTGGSYRCLDGSVIASDTDLLALKRTAAQASLHSGSVAANLTLSNGEVWYLALREGHRPRWEQLRPADLPALAVTSPAIRYWEAMAKIFFIRNYADTPGDHVPTLCAQTLAGNSMVARCLIEGVENLQLEFGVDTDGDGVANRYLQAPTGFELSGAVTARLYLLLRSLAEVSGQVDRNTYHLGAKAVTAPGDAYLRKVFSTTVRLRHRIEPIG